MQITATPRAFLRSISLHPSLRSIYAPMLLVLIPAAALYIVVTLYPFCVPFESLRSAYALAYEWLRVILVLEIARRYFNTLFIFDADGVTGHSGLLGLNLASASVDYRDIREVQLRQDLLGRLLDYGEIRISTAAKSDYEVVLPGMNCPHQVVEVFDCMRDEQELAAMEALPSSKQQLPDVHETLPSRYELILIPNLSTTVDIMNHKGSLA